MRKFLVLCVVAACGSSNPSHVDGATQDAAAARQGSVSVAQGDDGAGNAGQASAQFVMGSLQGTVVGTDGPCVAYASVPPPATLNAGTITVGGTLSAVTLTTTGSPLRYSAGGFLPYPLFSAGATITFTAAGGPDIPAFTGSVTAPADVAGFTKPTTLSRAGYTATWTAGAGPEFYVQLLGASATQNQLVNCTVPDNGSFTIPASTFALIPSSYTMGGVVVVRAARTTQTVGDTQITSGALTEISSTIIPLTQ